MNRLERLRAAYVEMAVEIASYEETHQLGSDNDTYVQMDRIERDIERAEQAIRLFRLHHMHVAIPAVAERIVAEANAA